MSTRLHVGKVAHVRHTPFTHRFAYSMWMLSCDLDAPQQSWLFRRNRPGIVSLHDADHGPRDGSALRPWAETLLARAGLGSYTARIRFMAIPRVFGYAFNPIAFYLCFDHRGKLGAIIHQVKNTFGDQTAYVLSITDPNSVIKQNTAKRMHVSPFFDMKGGYRFSFTNPDSDDFRITIRYGAEDTPRMTATMRLKARPLTDATLLRLLLAMPLMPLKVFAAIHWEAIRLKLRGARYHPLPPPVDPTPLDHQSGAPA
jgi:hypothetical protein